MALHSPTVLPYICPLHIGKLPRDSDSDKQPTNENGHQCLFTQLGEFALLNRNRLLIKSGWVNIKEIWDD